MKFICDTDILSCLGKINRFGILSSLFPNSDFNIPEQVYNELYVAKELGFSFPGIVFDFTNIVNFQNGELQDYLKLLRSQKSLGRGELQCIIIAKNRKWIMLTNDRIAKKIARSFGIKTWDILDILRALWVTEIKTKEEIASILSELEEKDGMIIKDKKKVLE